MSVAMNMNCTHGVRLFGPNPPPCDQCDLAWCESAHRVAVSRLAKVDKNLAIVRARIAGRSHAEV